MNATNHRPSLLLVQPAFVLGGLVALYFLLGRWTFARLDGEYDAVSIFEQPRVWVIAAIASISGLMFCVFRERRLSEVRWVDVTLILWLVYMLVSASWAPDRGLAAEKAIEVALLVTVAVAIALTRSPYNDGMAMLGFWYVLVSIGAAMGLLALYMSSSGRTFAPTGGPNIFGRNMGLVGIGALVLAGRNIALARLSLYVVVLLSILWVIMCGSRGALLASGVAAVVLLLAGRAKWTSKVLAVVTFSLAGLVVLENTQLGRTATDVFRDRILHLTFEERHTAARDSLFSAAIELGMQRPVAGWGLSGFRTHSWTYPHNILLETFAEGGTIGLTLLLLVGWTWWRTIKLRGKSIPGTTYAALALLVTSASFSGNLYDSRGVFVLIALSVDPLIGRGVAAAPIAAVNIAKRPAGAIAGTAGRVARGVHAGG